MLCEERGAQSTGAAAGEGVSISRRMRWPEALGVLTAKEQKILFLIDWGERR